MNPPSHEFSERLRRRYTISVHHDLRRRRLWPWWATLTHGIFHVGAPCDSVWRARSRQALIAKCERWIRRDMLRNGLAGEAEIRIEDRC